MHKLLAALSVVFFSSYATAEEAQHISVASALVCDTAEQVESFINRYNGDAHEAINAVNAAVGKQDACVVAALGFIKGEAKQTVRNGDAAYVVTEIIVVGAVTPNGFQLVEPIKWFTAYKVNETRA